MRGSCGTRAPHPARRRATFSLRAKSRLRRLRSDTRLRAQPLVGSPDCRKRCAHPLAPSARGLRPQAVGERTVRLPEIFRAMARFSPAAPSGHLPRRGRFFDTMRLSPKGKAFRYACSCTYRINASRSAVVRTTAVYIQSPMSRRSAWGIRSHIRIREPYLAMICAWVCLYSWQSRRPA